jgi:hypothetical protein
LNVEFKFNNAAYLDEASTAFQEMGGAHSLDVLVLLMRLPLKFKNHAVNLSQTHQITLIGKEFSLFVCRRCVTVVTALLSLLRFVPDLLMTLQRLRCHLCPGFSALHPNYYLVIESLPMMPTFVASV